MKTSSRVSEACTVCRAQHLRCDAALPACSRCLALGKRCMYSSPRRSPRTGAKPGRDGASMREPGPRGRNGLPASASGSGSGRPREARAPASEYPSAPGAESSALLSSVLPECNPSALLSPVITIGPSPALAIEASASAPAALGPGTDSLATSTAIDSFYAYFFDGHPFVLPRAHFLRQHTRDAAAVAALPVVMCLIGSLYVRDGRAAAAYRHDAERLLQRQQPDNGFSVQALLLLALVLEWSGESERADAVLHRAKALALALALNRQSFAVDHGGGEAVVEESWRRTWWELYVVDALFAGIRHWPTFSLWTVVADVDLPGEEACYVASNILPPQTLTEYDNRGFEAGDDGFSSFAYLVDAARILGTSLAAGDIAGGSPLTLVKNAEANIMSWHLHLPASKRDAVRADGSVDEMLFRAHMVINTVATHLHRPRSTLHYSTMELLCSNYAPPLAAEVVAPEDKHHDRHTHKAMRAAMNFVDLLTAGGSPTSHSPFVMCMGSLAMATHMSACEYHLRGVEHAHARDRVRVFLGILKAFEGIWAQAAKWSSEIKLMAKAVFEMRDAHGNLISSPGSLRVKDVHVSPAEESLDAILEDVSFGDYGDG